MQKRKNLMITTEINNYIKGSDNKENISENKVKNDKNNNYKFIPERLKEQNENDFFMKGIIKNNNNFVISKEQRINIENNLNNKINNNNKEKNNNIINNENNELNLNIEDIVSTRDILLENNNLFNNNNSPKLDSLISPIPPKIENESKIISNNETNREKNLTYQQSIIITDLFHKNNINQNEKEELKNKEEENSLKLLIEDNKIKKEEENFENANISDNNKEKDQKIKIEMEVQDNLNELENSLELNNGKKLMNMKEKKLKIMLLKKII